MSTAVEVTQKFVDALNEKFAPQATFSVMPMRKHDRIVIERAPSNLPLAHAFVERETGKLYKAGGWSGPKQNASYNLTNPDDFALAVQKADIYGGYLYAGKNSEGK